MPLLSVRKIYNCKFSEVIEGDLFSIPTRFGGVLCTKLTANTFRVHDGKDVVRVEVAREDIEVDVICLWITNESSESSVITRM